MGHREQHWTEATHLQRPHNQHRERDHTPFPTQLQLLTHGTQRTALDTQDSTGQRPLISRGHTTSTGRGTTPFPPLISSSSHMGHRGQHWTQRTALNRGHSSPEATQPAQGEGPHPFPHSNPAPHTWDTEDSTGHRGQHWTEATHPQRPHNQHRERDHPPFPTHLQLLTHGTQRTELDTEDSTGQRRLEMS